MARSVQSAITWIILAVMIFALVFALTFLAGQLIANGQTQSTTQQKVAEVQEQVQDNTAQLDGTTAGLGIAGAGIAATFLNQFIKGRKLKKSDDITDKDTGLSFLYIYRLIQTMDAMIPAVSKCLDQPFNNDPMQKHLTIRMKLADDANSTAQYLMTTLNTSPPSMTPAGAVIIADAQNTQTAESIKNTKPETVQPVDQKPSS